MEIINLIRNIFALSGALIFMAIAGVITIILNSAGYPVNWEGMAIFMLAIIVIWDLLKRSEE